jgi:hypothetical protein
MAQGHPELITDFFQGNVKVDSAFAACTADDKHGNCAAIAVIKAALADFGSIDRIFTVFRRESDSVRCTFRDGTVIVIGEGQRTIVRNTADLRAGTPATFHEDAITLYALICKRMWVRRSAFTPSKKFSKCVHSYRDAVMYLNSGYPTIHAYRLLALDNVAITDYSTLATLPSAIVYSSVHAGFVTMGQQDRFGESFPIQQRRAHRGRRTGPWMMGTANGNQRKIEAAYHLAVPQ